MYVYFDSQGVLKEVITDEIVRNGDNLSKTIHIFFEEEKDSIIYDDVSLLFNSEVERIIPSPVLVPQMLEVKEDRDLKYFKNYKSYRFWNYVLTSEDYVQGLNTLVIKKRIGSDEQWISCNGVITLYVEGLEINDPDIRKSEYEYLISLVGEATGKISDIVGHVIEVVATRPSSALAIEGRVYYIDEEEAFVKYVGGGVWDFILSSGEIESCEKVSNKKTTITNNNTDYPTTKAVKDALATKQDNLTFDNEPTENSTNPVTSGGVFNAMREGLSGLIVDEVTDGEMKAVTSNAVNDALARKENTSNKKTTITNSNTDYPTTKAVKNALANKADLVGGKIPTSQLPAYVDDVQNITSIETIYESKEELPTAQASNKGSTFIVYDYNGATEDIRKGILYNCVENSGVYSWVKLDTLEPHKIYVVLDTNKTYRFTNPTSSMVVPLVEISPSLALGETSSTAYAGNKGKANADAIEAIKNGTTIDSFGDVENVLANIHSQVEIDNTETSGTVDVTADQTNMLNVRNVVKRGFTYFRYHHKTTNPDKIYYVSVNKDGKEEIVEYVVSTHTWTYSSKSMGGVPVIEIDLAQIIIQSPITALLTQEQYVLIENNDIAVYYAILPNEMEGYLYKNDHNTLYFYIMTPAEGTAPSHEVKYVAIYHNATHILSLEYVIAPQYTTGIEVDVYTDTISIQTYDGDTGGNTLHSTDKVLVATRSQSFNAAEKAQLWANLGLENLDEEDF